MKRQPVWLWIPIVLFAVVPLGTCPSACIAQGRQLGWRQHNCVRCASGQICNACQPSNVGGSWQWTVSPEEQQRVVASLFNRYCLRCHGVDGRGVWDMPDVPNFCDPMWQGSRTDEQLVRLIMEGRGAVMPAFHGTLNRDEAWAMAGYLRTFVDGPRFSRFNSDWGSADPSSDSDTMTPMWSPDLQTGTLPNVQGYEPWNTGLPPQLTPPGHISIASRMRQQPPPFLRRPVFEQENLDDESQGQFPLSQISAEAPSRLPPGFPIKTNIATGGSHSSGPAVAKKTSKEKRSDELGTEAKPVW